MRVITKIRILFALLLGTVIYQQIELHQIKTELQGIESFITQWSE